MDHVGRRDFLKYATLPAVQEKFAATYRAAGGICELTIFENSEHEWVAKPRPQTTRAQEMVTAFIARQFAANPSAGGRS